MPRRIDKPMLATALVLTGLSLAAASWGEYQQPARASTAPASQSPAEAGRQSAASVQQDAAPTPAEVQERAAKVIANQHGNDDASEVYEYVERQVIRTGGANPRTVDEKVYRVVPTGTGTLKILLKDNSRTVDSSEYRRQLQRWEDVLELMLNPNDPRTQNAYAKSQKKKRERADLVDAMNRAFVPRWMGREEVNGRECDVIELDPDPKYRPRSILQEVLTRVTAKIWLDPGSDQLVRGEAHVIRDLSVGGGILGKLYRGGVFSMEQTEVAPGVWLPTRYQYDFSGRKFLFTFETHQVIEVTKYRRVGRPKEALQTVKDELATGKRVSGDP